MSERDRYEHGVPCWVEAIEHDAGAAREFYGELFGWEFESSGPIADGPAGEYFVARVRGRDVAGIAPTPRNFEFSSAFWSTQVQVDDAEAAGELAIEAGGSILAGPFDFEGIGRLVVIADPQGASLGLWEPDGRVGARIVNEPNAWAMSALGTSDTEAAAGFYGRLFGWTTETFGEGTAAITMFRLPGYVGGEPGQPVSREVVAVMSAAPADQPAAWVPGFWVADIDRAVATVNDLGGSAVTPVEETPVGHTAVVLDPQGAPMTLTMIAAHPAEPESAA